MFTPRDHFTGQPEDLRSLENISGFSHKTFAIKGESENKKSKLLFPFRWKLKVKSESEDGKIAFSQWSVLPLGLTYWV